MAWEYTPLWTFSDMVESLVDSARGSGLAEERRLARRVVMDCYREFPQRADWSYFNRTGQVRTEASSTAGTLAYDHTGGSSERLVTLTGDTIDTTTGKYFSVIIANVHYPVDKVLSTTTFTLTEGQNPGADVAAGTSYTLYRSFYPVPSDYRRGQEPVEFDGAGTSPVFVPPADLLNAMQFSNDPQSWFQFYTVRGLGKTPSEQVFEFAPPPSTALTMKFNYLADPRPIGLIGSATQYSTGTITISGTGVEGSGTAFTDRMVGSVLRVPPSGVDQIPTGVGGARDGDYPYAEQAVITSVTDADTLTIDSAMTGSHSGVKFSIGDPLELDYHCMMEAFRSLCEWRFSVLLKDDRKVTAEKESQFIRDFRRAREADNREPSDSGRIPLPRYWELYE